MKKTTRERVLQYAQSHDTFTVNQIHDFLTVEPRPSRKAIQCAISRLEDEARIFFTGETRSRGEYVYAVNVPAPSPL